MNKKLIYIFSDWTNTINEIYENKIWNEEYFIEYYNALKMVEKTFNANVNLVIVSGSSIKSTLNLTDLFIANFKKIGRDDIYQGTASEYGGYFIDTDLNVNLTNSADISAQEKTILNNLADKYNFHPLEDYTRFASFELDVNNPNSKLFIEEVRNNLPNCSFEEYCDKYGYGIDVKSPNLTKLSFVENYLKNHPIPDWIIVCGDGKEDIEMLNNTYKEITTYLGFDEKYKSDKTIISNKKNILGIIENLKNFCKEKK